MADNVSISSHNDAWMNNESMTSYDSDDDDGDVLEQHFETMEITGITDVLPRVSSVQSDDSWAVESYANDSILLAHLRLDHSHMEHDDDDMSLGYGSASGGAQQQQQQDVRANWVMDEDDWTIQSDCNDSIGLVNARMGRHEAPAPPPQPEPTPAPVVATANSPRPLVRIPRRRASMGDFVEKEQQQLSPPPQVQQQQPRQLRRMTLSSVESLSTVEESLCSGRSNNNSNNPACDANNNKKRINKSGRHVISRTKSMPYVKPPSLSTTVPLWPAESEQSPQRRKMDRRVSNGGTPCAA